VRAILEAGEALGFVAGEPRMDAWRLTPNFWAMSLTEMPSRMTASTAS
jgi:hypothetical protein